MQGKMIAEDRWRRNMNIKPPARRPSRICTALAIAGLTISLTSLTRASSIELVKNGSFENSTVARLGSQIRIPNQASCISPGFRDCGMEGGRLAGTNATNGTYPVINDWTAMGFVMLFKPEAGTSGTSADVSGAVTQFNNANAPFRLFGPGNPASIGGAVHNGLTLSPDGGNFVVLDGDSQLQSVQSQGEIFQPIPTVAHDKYNVTFFWAAGQQAQHPGPTEEQLRAGFCPNIAGGTPTQGLFVAAPVTLQPAGPGTNPCVHFTSVVHLNHAAFGSPAGSTGKGTPQWEKQTFTFTANSSSTLLSFLALGSPTGMGAPPIVLLDGVSVKQQSVPEPNTSSLLGIAFAAIAGVAYRRPKWLRFPD